MVLLSLEASTTICSAAVCAGEGRRLRVLSSREGPAAQIQGPGLLRLVGEAAAGSGLVLAQMDAFAVGLAQGFGPLMETALKLTKGLALANGKPLVPVSSLHALAESAAGGLPTGVLLIPMLGG